MFNFTPLYKMNTSPFNNFFVNSLNEVIGQWKMMFDEYEQHPTREGFDNTINAFGQRLKPYRAAKEEADRQSLIKAMKATPGIGVFTK